MKKVDISVDLEKLNRDLLLEPAGSLVAICFDKETGDRFLLYEADIPNFNPLLYGVDLSQIANDRQYNLVKRETEFLSSNLIGREEASRLSDLYSLLEDYLFNETYSD